MNRREWLKLGGAALVGGCVRAARPGAARLRLPRVAIDSPTVIRRPVGLRPFRPGGFVVEAVKLGDQLVVHNYGHGGGGVTLSWGTAELAADEALRAGARRAAVLGAGAVGLATARVLQERGVEVAIYARDLPPHTTSDVAGAQWFPFGVYDEAAATPAFRDRFADAARRAWRRYRALDGARFGVWPIANYFLGHRRFLERGLLGRDGPIAPLAGAPRDLSLDESPFPYPWARRIDTLLIEPPRYLPALLEEVRAAGAAVIQRELHDLAEVAQLPEPVVVNCTGLGARRLFGDEELTPMRGQLALIPPQPGIDYTTVGTGDDLYMFPRSDAIVLGGTFERGVESLEPDPAAEARILHDHAWFFGAMR